MSLKAVSHPNGVELPDKLNYGCGNDIDIDAVNIDIDIPSTATLLAGNRRNTIQSTPWIFKGQITSPSDLPANHFRHIKAFMVMEHVHIDAIPTLLYCFNAILEMHGRLVITVPNFHAIASLYVESMANVTPLTFDLDVLMAIREFTFQLLDPTLYETKAARGHQSLWTPAIAEYWLKGEGFKVTNTKSIDKNGLILEITATKEKELSIGDI